MSLSKNLEISEPRAERLLFSVVMPIYNVEQYLEEAIESVVNQDIGFVDNVELLLLNDGSPDNSEEICLRYQAMYPGNIRYLPQENRGVSFTRNRGIALAQGKYIGFLDPDDKYRPETLRVVGEFYANHEDLDLVSVPIRFFGVRKGDHVLNEKFQKGPRVIDVRRNWSEMQGSLSSSFVRRSSVLELGLRLDKRLKYAEDLKFVTQLIMSKQKYGVTSEGGYDYRKRASGDSALDTNTQRYDYYSPVLEYFAKSLFEQFLMANGDVPRYVQMVVMYDLQWRLKQGKQSVLKDFELDDYKRRFLDLLKYIDIPVIMRQRHIHLEHKIYLFQQKYGDDPLESSIFKDGAFHYRGHRLWNAKPESFTCHLDHVAVDGPKVVLRGRFKGIPFKAVTPGFKLNGLFCPADLVPAPSFKRNRFLGDTVFSPIYFDMTLPLSDARKVVPAVKFGGFVFETQFRFGRNSGMIDSTSSYRMDGTWIIQNVRNEYLAFKRKSPRLVLKRELGFWKSVRSDKKPTSKLRRKPRLAMYRFLAVLIRLMKKKEIWIVSDRFSVAGDNGEAFYRYLIANQDRGRKVYFLQKKQTSEYRELRKVGRVVSPDTARGRLLYLVADVFASSQADEYVLNPFGPDQTLMRDLYTFKFVFLQHGVITHNLSGWLNCFDKPISKFVTSSPREYQSILDGEYGFGESEVALTGLPRYDRLTPAGGTKLVIAPTWRAYLAEPVDPQTNLRGYSESFKHSEFFRFYQELISTPRLNRALEKNDMVGEFVLHPSHGAQFKDFSGTSRISVAEPPHVYRELISDSQVFVTDYSSVAVDAAYLRKSIIYTQFDYEELFSRHTYEQGYFDYRVDGFGPVMTAVESTVDAIIYAIENRGKPQSEYLDRMNRFFAFDDQRNSERVQQTITAAILKNRKY